MRFVGGFSLGLLVYRIEGVGVHPSICTFFNFYATLDSTCAFSISGPWIFFLSYVRKYSCFRSTGYSILLMYVRITYLHTYSYVRCFILHFYIGFHVCIFDLWALDILLTYLRMYSCLRGPGYSILLTYERNFCNVIETVKMPHQNELYSTTTKSLNFNILQVVIFLCTHISI